MRLHIAALQQQVDILCANLESLRQPSNGSNPGHETTYLAGGNLVIPAGGEPSSFPSPHLQRKKLSRFHGPTSSTYGLDVANSTLQTMGITQGHAIDEIGVLSDRTATASPVEIISPHPSKDSLSAISRKEATRLSRVYEEEIGILYPLFDIEEVIGQVNRLWNSLEAPSGSGIGHSSRTEATDDEDTNLVKMILAAALVLEGNGQSDVGQKIFESLKPAVTANLWGRTDLKGLSLLCVAVRSLS